MATQTSAAMAASPMRENSEAVSEQADTAADMAVEEEEFPILGQIEYTVRKLSCAFDIICDIDLAGTEEDPCMEILVHPLRKIMCDLAIYMGVLDASYLTSDDQPEDPSLSALHHTNAEQASTLAQNADSSATLMHILESKLPQVLLDNAQADRFNSALQNDLSASIHAPTSWSTSMKWSSNPLLIKPQPKKKVMPPPSNPFQRNHNCCLLIEFFPKIEPKKHEVTEELADKWAGFKGLEINQGVLYLFGMLC
ncbi:hypothetical protein BS47DRAFT_1369065 [Hydnum rufescens UP504]|uniref:Uncharacterized protein n=1 Tax=Hydnum rufescens UP504 TaxID=1448309 RepID=A0A9P6AED8_9AGAM|nr:hypothetical protein BS47DRAFT_1369065 [Hydnum rufescens UP504]